MKTLTQEQVDAFLRDGYLMVEDAVTPSQLAALQAETRDWVEQSRAHQQPFGPPTIDGRPRFDMGAEHSAEKPALRRINNPSDISNAYREVMLDARTVDIVADLIGPDVKFHHCKINLKLSGAKTEVSYHQDFAYTPHTNDDKEARFARLSEGLVVLPKQPRTASFFTVIGQESKQAAE